MRIEQLVDEGNDAVVQGVDAGRSELVHHQPPQTVVLRRVEEEERAWLEALCADERNLRLALVMQQGGDVGVAADGEKAIGQRRDRSLAQPGVERVRVKAVGWVEDLREELGGSLNHLRHKRPPRWWLRDGYGGGRASKRMRSWRHARILQLRGSGRGGPARGRFQRRRWRARTGARGSGSRAVGGVTSRREPGRPDDRLCRRIGGVERRREWSPRRDQSLVVVEPERRIDRNRGDDSPCTTIDGDEVQILGRPLGDDELVRD